MEFKLAVERLNQILISLVYSDELSHMIYGIQFPIDCRGILRPGHRPTISVGSA